jgi:hypothetical protein
MVTQNIADPRSTIGRLHTATHEAGHAVIARVLTLACGGASIQPDYANGCAGHSIIADVPDRMPSYLAKNI